MQNPAITFGIPTAAAKRELDGTGWDLHLEKLNSFFPDATLTELCPDSWGYPLVNRTRNLSRRIGGNIE